MKRIGLICAVVCAFVLTSCSKIEDTLKGSVWHSTEAYSWGTIRFVSDTGFIWDLDGGSVSGTYSYEYPNVTMVLSASPDGYFPGYVDGAYLYITSRDYSTHQFSRVR